MTRVVHIINGLKDGGAEALLYKLTKESFEFEHVVISLGGGDKYGELLNREGVAVYCLSMNGNLLLGFFRLWKLLKRLKPDAVQTWMIHSDFIGGIAAKLAGFNNISWGIHHTFLVVGKSSISSVFLFYLNSVLSYIIPRNVVYCARSARRYSENFGYKRSVGIVITNGYDSESLTISEEKRLMFRDRLNIGPQTFVVGNVSRFHPQKDHFTLIRAASLLNLSDLNILFVLVGSGLDSSNENLLSEIRKFKLEKYFILLGQHSEVDMVMNGMDLFVLSSAFGEAFPNVLNEAMLCGTACITTDVGDATDIVGPFGWVVAPRDPSMISYFIQEAYFERFKREDDWNERSVNCRRRIVDNFSYDEMRLSYERLWKFE